MLQPLTTRGVASEVMLLGGLKHDSDPASVSGAHQQYTAGRVLVGKNIDPSDAAAKISSLDVAIHHQIASQASLTTQRMTLGTAGRTIYGQGSGLVDADFENDSNGNRIFLNSTGEPVFGTRSDMTASGSYDSGATQDATNNPRLAFNTLFCNGSTTCPGGGTLNGMGSTTPPVDPTIAPRLSVLHYVADRISKLKSSRQLGTVDAQKVDQYLTGIEDIETRLNQTTPMMMNGRVIQIPPRTTYRSIPSAQGGLAMLMMDLMVKAFEANLMNVGTMLMGATDGSNITANTQPDSQLWDTGANIWVHDHESSHGESAYDPNHGGDFSAATTKVSTAKVDVFAYLIQQLKATSDITGTLLDHTLVYYSSDFGNGHTHDVTNVPVMLAGHVPGLVQGGTYKSLSGIPAVRVMVSVASQFGVTLPQANGQTGAL